MAEEIWFTVEQETPVVAQDGKTVLGRLKPGTRYRASGRDEHWLKVLRPDGNSGFVAARAVTIIEVAPESSTPSPPPAASAPPPSSSTSPPAAAPARPSASAARSPTTPPRMSPGPPPPEARPSPASPTPTEPTPPSAPPPAQPAAAPPPSGPSPARIPAPPSPNSRPWLIPTVIAAVVVVGAIAAVTLLGGGDDTQVAPTTLASSTIAPTTQPPATTSTAQSTTSTTQATATTTGGQSDPAVPASLSFAGLTTTDFAAQYPAHAAAHGVSDDCAELVEMAPVTMDDERLQPGESFVFVQARAGCESSLWAIEDAGGQLRELSLQLPNPTRASVDDMIFRAIALIMTVGSPDVDAGMATGYLDEIGWLFSSNITAHEGIGTFGAVRMGTFTDGDSLIFFMLPAD